MGKAKKRTITVQNYNRRRPHTEPKATKSVHVQTHARQIRLPIPKLRLRQIHHQHHVRADIIGCNPRTDTVSVRTEQIAPTGEIIGKNKRTYHISVKRGVTLQKINQDEAPAEQIAPEIKAELPDKEPLMIGATTFLETKKNNGIASPNERKFGDKTFELIDIRDTREEAQRIATGTMKMFPEEKTRVGPVSIKEESKAYGIYFKEEQEHKDITRETLKVKTEKGTTTASPNERKFGDKTFELIDIQDTREEAQRIATGTMKMFPEEKTRVGPVVIKKESKAYGIYFKKEPKSKSKKAK